jgi:hypothetical protein
VGFENGIFKLFSTNTSIKIMSGVKIDNKNYLKVEGKGIVEVQTLSGIKSLKNILYVPEINGNIVSIGQLIEPGYSLFFLMMECVTLKTIKGLLLLTIKIMDKSFNVDWK